MAQVFVVFYVIAYCAPYWFEIPLPLYFPLERHWSFIEHEGWISQRWYGRVAFAFLAGGASSFLFRLVPIQQWKSNPPFHRILSGLMIVVLYAGLVYIALHELTNML